MENKFKVEGANGRFLTYAIYGDEAGVPVIYNHGWPSSRLEGAVWDACAKRLGAKLIAIDRPGYGGSDFQNGRSILDWPADVGAVADSLGIDKFYLLGLSGGGPYTAVCAHKIPERLLGVTIVAGISPWTNPQTKEGMRGMNKIMFGLGRVAPFLLKLLMLPMKSAVNNPDTIQKMLSDLPEADKAVFTPETTAVYMDMAQEAFRQGVNGAVHGGRLYATDWGFSLKEVQQPINIWQGTADVNVPVGNGRIYAAELPHATVHIIEGEGHLSLVVNHQDTILAELLGK